MLGFHPLTVLLTLKKNIMKFLFFPSPYRFGRQAYNIVSSGFVGKEYFECVKYEDGRFDEALFQLSLYKDIDLIEISKANLTDPSAILKRFSHLLLKGQTPDVIRVVISPARAD
jgi:hypothetical protein